MQLLYIVLGFARPDNLNPLQYRLIDGNTHTTERIPRPLVQ